MQKFVANLNKKCKNVNFSVTFLVKLLYFRFLFVENNQQSEILR